MKIYYDVSLRIDEYIESEGNIGNVKPFYYSDGELIIEPDENYNKNNMVMIYGHFTDDIAIGTISPNEINISLSECMHYGIEAFKRKFGNDDGHYEFYEKYAEDIELPGDYYLFSKDEKEHDSKKYLSIISFKRKIRSIEEQKRVEKTIERLIMP